MHMTFKLAGSSVLLATMLCVAPARADAEVFVDLGFNATRVEADIATLPDTISSTQSGVHLGAGVRRALRSGSIGARIELDDVDSDLLLAVRALDYQRYLSERIAIGAFLGAARLDLATPAYGYYLGGGMRLRDVLPSWDLGIDLRLGDKIARDNLLPSDPQGGRPDNFYDLTGISLYLSRRF
jgi:hypothetical protein